MEGARTLAFEMQKGILSGQWNPPAALVKAIFQRAGF
jgi:hypothetical protein